MNFILDSVGPSFVCFVGPSFVYGSKFCLFCLPDGSLGFFFSPGSSLFSALRVAFALSHLGYLYCLLAHLGPSSSVTGR